MKIRVIVIFAVLVILAGCASPDVVTKTTPVDANVPSEDINKPDVPVFEAPKESKPEPISEGRAQFYVGSDGELAGHKIKLLSMNDKGQSSFEIDGVKWDVYTTKTREVVNNLDFRVDSFYYDITNESNRSVVLVGSELKLAPNEFLLKWGDKKTIGDGVSIKIDAVRKSPRAVRFEVNNALSDFVLIEDGTTEPIEGISVTVVDSFPRVVQYETYTIIRVEE